jgi:hypothetical protein
MREWETYQRDTVTAFVREALAVRKPSKADVARASALFDLPTFRAMRERSIAVADAVTTIARIVACLIDGHHEKNEGDNHASSGHNIAGVRGRRR